jgi:hypothetical protein
MVGVGRDVPADSGNGSELYAVIGQSPRNLDRNVTLVGRVIEGIELFSVLPRGTAALEPRWPCVSTNWSVFNLGYPVFAVFFASRL